MKKITAIIFLMISGSALADTYIYTVGEVAIESSSLPGEMVESLEIKEIGKEENDGGFSTFSDGTCLLDIPFIGAYRYWKTSDQKICKTLRPVMNQRRGTTTQYIVEYDRDRTWTLKKVQLLNLESQYVISSIELSMKNF